MVRKYYCDKCGEKIDKEEDVIDGIFESFGVSMNKPELCDKCFKGYKKIIDRTNKEIKEWIKSK